MSATLLGRRELRMKRVLVAAATRRVNRHYGELLAFFVVAMTSDLVAISTGRMTLKDHFHKAGEQG